MSASGENATTPQADTGRNAKGQFKPGVSGNPGGRPKTRVVSHILRKLEEQGYTGETRAEIAAERFVEQLENGSPNAWKEFLARDWPTVTHVKADVTATPSPQALPEPTDQRRELVAVVAPVDDTDTD